MTDTLFDKFMISVFGDEPSVSKKDALPDSLLAKLLILQGCLSIVIPTVTAMLILDNTLSIAGVFFLSVFGGLGSITAGYLIQYVYDIRNILLKQWELPHA